MLTIFACPKPFTDPHIATIQRNAITSWTLLRPAPEIMLFGDEEGTAQICSELALRHLPRVARNEYGTPLLSDLFGQAERLASNRLLCYVNADIILMSDFMQAAESVSGLERRFLMAGQRCDLDIRESLAFESGWEDRLRLRALREGRLTGPKGIDYFLFPRGLWGMLPDLALGRFHWDNWLLYRARALKSYLIDATSVITIVHQKHGYSFSNEGPPLRDGPEARRNKEIAGDFRQTYTLDDATHRLTSAGLRLWPTGLLHLRSGRHRWLWFSVLAWSRPLRHRLGLRKTSIES
jgi:hypothetical protein